MKEPETTQKVTTRTKQKCFLMASMFVKGLHRLVAGIARTILWKHLPPAKKQKLKSIYYRTRKRAIDLAFSYSYGELVQALADLDIGPGDVLMVHSSFTPFNGFQGKPQEIIRALREVIGPGKGTLLMVSLPYTGSTYEYLKETKVFDVNRTMSKMGLISEIFRRQNDVVRSLHPTHPVLACGPLADWFAQGHEDCLYGCGPGTPFEKLAQKGGKVLFFDTRFTFTFLHYLEHLIQDKLPFPLYAEETFAVKVVDAEGKHTVVKAKAFSLEAVRRRRAEKLLKQLRAEGKVTKRRIGMTDLVLVKARDAMVCVDEMTRKGEFFYELGEY